MNIRRLVFIVAIVVLQTSDAIAGERCRKVRIRKGRSHMLLRRKMIKYACRNGFTLVGSRTAICVSGRWSRQPPVCVAPGCPTVIGSWRVRVSHLYDGAVLSFTCGESYALKGKQVIYCNGKTWNSKPPSCIATDAESACDFEQDICGWTNSDQDQFDWIVGSDETPTIFTGPSWDHTFGDGLKQGFYLYTEMSSPRQPGDSAQLWSPIFPSTYSGKCFQFWYHMFGRAEVGSLSVFMKPIKEKFPGRLPVVVVVGNQGDEWQVQHVTIPPLHEEFQIIIVVERNQSVFSDIAIDDVSVISCPEHIQEPETGSRDTTASASFVTMTSHKDNLPTSVRDISTRKAPITGPTTPTTDTQNTMNTAYTTGPNFRNTANLSTVDTDPTEKGLSAHPNSTAATEVTEGTLDATVWSKEEDTSTSHESKSWGTTETLTSIAVGSVTKHKSGQYDVAAISMPGTQHEKSTTTEVFSDTTARITEHLVHRTTAPPVANISTNTTMLTRREDLVTDRAEQESDDTGTTTHLVTYTVTHRDEVVADNTEQVIDAVSQATQSDKLVIYSTQIVTKNTEHVTDISQTDTVSQVTQSDELGTNSTQIVTKNTEHVTDISQTDTVSQVTQSDELGTNSTQIVTKITQPVTDNSQTGPVPHSVRKVTQNDELITYSTQIVTKITQHVTDNSQTEADREHTTVDSPTLRDNSQVTTNRTHPSTEDEQSVTYSQHVVREQTIISEQALLSTRTTTKSGIVVTAPNDTAIVTPMSSTRTHLHKDAGVDRTITEAQDSETTTKGPATTENKTTASRRYVTEGSSDIAVLANNRTGEYVTSGIVQDDSAVPVLPYRHQRVTLNVTLLVAVLATAVLVSLVVGVVMWVVVNRQILVRE